MNPNPKNQFKKGNKGKPKGAIHKKTHIWNEIGEWFASDGIEQYKANLSEMLASGNPVQRAEGMKRLEAMMEFFKPKLNRTALTDGDDKALNLSPTINVLPPNGSNT